MRKRVYVRVCRKMALPTVTSCFRIHAAAAYVLVASLRRWVPIDLGDGGDLQASPKRVTCSCFPLAEARRARRRSPPEGRCGLPVPQPRRPPPRRPARLAAQLPARPKRGEAQAAGLGGGAGSPAAKLAARPATAARVAPRAVRGCTAGQSLCGRGGALRQARP